MSFRTKLVAFFTVSAIAVVALIAWGESVYTRRTFDQFDHDRSLVLVAQFRREYAQRGNDIAQRVQNIADAEATLRMAMDLNRPQADASQYYNDAHALAQGQQLDFLDIIGDDGTLVSSAEWPARFGYKTDWIAGDTDWNSQGAFLRRVELSDGVELGLVAVRVVRVGEKNLYLVGGQRFNADFLRSLVLPTGMRALIYLNFEPGFVPAALSSPSSSSTLAAQTDRFATVIADVQRTRAETARTIDWGPNAASAESVEGIPLNGRQNDLLAVLLVGSSRRSLIAALNFTRALALMAGGGIIILAVIFGWWISARFTRPIEQIAVAIKQVTDGRSDTRVRIRSRDEIGYVATAFNDMTSQLSEQREGLVQTERVIAWREMARRMAQDLKKPLFPLQLTVENLQRAREQTSEQFDGIFFESTAVLRAELQNLKEIAGRFSDFAKMSPPELEPVDLNESLRGVIKVFEPQFNALGRPPITPEVYLDENLPHLHGDPMLLRCVIENLLLNALDAMPAGGTLTVRTSYHNGCVRLDIADTGVGRTPEECTRLLAPDSSQPQATGLALAIVQSVVSDHGGRIIVESTPGAGAMFRVELPIGVASAASQGMANESVGPELKAPIAKQTQVDDPQAPLPLSEHNTAA